MNKENINFNQKKFLEYYAATLNAVKSAQLAGYKTKSAQCAAGKILNNPKKLASFEKIVNENARKLNITRAFIVSHYLKIIEHAFFEDENGLKDPQLALRALDGLCKHLNLPERSETFGVTKAVFDEIEGLDPEKI